MVGLFAFCYLSLDRHGKVLRKFGFTDELFGIVWMLVYCVLCAFAVGLEGHVFGGVVLLHVGYFGEESISSIWAAF